MVGKSFQSFNVIGLFLRRNASFCVRFLRFEARIWPTEALLSVIMVYSAEVDGGLIYGLNWVSVESQHRFPSSQSKGRNFISGLNFVYGNIGQFGHFLLCLVPLRLNWISFLVWIGFLATFHRRSFLRSCFLCGFQLCVEFNFFLCSEYVSCLILHWLDWVKFSDWIEEHFLGQIFCLH